MLSPNVCPPSPCRICSVRCWPEAETMGRPGASFCGFDKQSVFFRFQVPLYQLCRSLIMDILPYCDRFRVAIGLCFVILFNRPEFCPLEDPLPPQSGFLQIPPHDGHPCLWLILPTTGRIRDFHPIERALTGRTSKRAVAARFYRHRPCG